MTTINNLAINQSDIYLFEVASFRERAIKTLF